MTNFFRATCCLSILLAGTLAVSSTAQDAKEIKNSLGMTLVAIAPGKFKMGTGEKGNDALEKMIKGEVQRIDEQEHDVEITQPFHIGKYEVTQAEYERVMKANPSHFKGDKLPVENVTWNNAKEFCARLSKNEGKEYTLPTEAEWEYCCRAGTQTLFSFGDTLTPAQANFKPPMADSDPDRELARKTSPIGSFPANAWGLHDMHGNVWEWCEDWRGVFYYRESPLKDPKGPDIGRSKVIRGGSWFYEVVNCRSANRSGVRPELATYNIGFRVVLRPGKAP